MTKVVAERYELTGELGTGGMATVHRARDRKLGRDVAVKVMHREIGAQAGGRERFMHEAKAAASFNHPGAVAVYDTGTADGVPYIVMELVEGTTLADALDERGALTPAEAVAIASQLLSALAAAHRRGLVHRDVKPANVLLPGGVVPSAPDAEPSVKLADFGIAKGVEQAQAGLTGTGQVLGTPKYISPEQVAGQPATPRSDVYSTGVVLYEMLAGAPPFAEGGSLAVALAHRDDPVPRLDRRVRGLSPGLVAVVNRALEKDPKRRFADGAEMRAALADPSRMGAAATAPIDAAAAPTQVLADTTTASPPPRQQTAPRAAAKPRGSSWKLAAIIGTLALVALALVAVDWDGLLDAGEPEEEPTEEPTEPDDPEPEPDEPDDPEPGPDPEPEPDEPEPDEPEPDEPEPRDAPAEEDPEPSDAEPDEDEQSSRQGDEAGDDDGDGRDGGDGGDGDGDTSGLEDLAATLAVVTL